LNFLLCVAASSTMSSKLVKKGAAASELELKLAAEFEAFQVFIANAYFAQFT
jgi:hypothetical protein